MTKNPLLLRVILAAFAALLVVASIDAQTVETALPTAWERARHHHAKPAPTPTQQPGGDPNGIWIYNANTTAQNWSNPAAWQSGIIADGGGIADFSTLNIGGNRGAIVDTSRTIGILQIGDTNNDKSYTISASGGSSLIFDNVSLSGANTQINQTSGSGGDTISAPVVLNSSLDVTNASSTASLLTLSGGVTAGTAGTKTITTSTGAVTFSGVIAPGGGGDIAILQNGPGTLTLSGANTFGGGTTVAGGTLVLQANGVVTGGLIGSGPVGTGTLTLSNGATLRSNGTATRTLENNLSLSGSLTLGDATKTGTLTFTNTDGTNTLTTPPTVTLVNNTSFNLASAVTINDAIGGNFALTTSGAGLLSLLTANSFSGGLNINSGSVSFNNKNALGSGTITLGSLGGGNASLTASGSITGTPNNIVVAAGSGGILTLGSTNTTANNISYLGTLTLNGSVSLTSSNTGSGMVIITGQISGTGGITEVGTGIVQLNHNNLFTGGVTINSGTLQSSANTALGPAANATLTFGSGSTGKFQLNGFATTIVDLNSNATIGTPVIENASVTPQTLTLNTPNLDTYAGVLQDGTGGGALSFTMGGAGTILLSGSNSYTGTTTVSLGTLAIGNNSALGTSALSIKGGTITATGGARSIANNTTLGVGSGTIGGSNDLTITGSFTNSGSNRTLTVNNTGLTTLGNVFLSEISTIGRTLILAGTGNVTIAGVIADFNGVGMAGSLTDNDSGILTLSSGSTYTGVTNLNSGSVALGNKAAFGTSLINLGGTNISANTDLSGANAIANASTLSATTMFGGSNNLEMAGIMTASGSFNLTNSMTAGVLTLSGGLALSNSAANNVITLKGTGDTIVSGAITNGLSSASGIAKLGNGNLTFSGGSGNTYTGLTTVSAGELDLNKTTGLNSIAGDGNSMTTDLTVSGGTLRWKSSNQVADDVTIVESTGTVDLNAKTETLGSFSNSGGTFTTGKNGHLIGTGASVTWSGGSNTINADGSVEDAHVIITGGTNTVQGLAGTPVGTTAGGNLKINSGGAGLEMTGATLTLNSDSSRAGTLTLLGNLTSHASAATSAIANGGSATVAGTIDIGAGSPTITVEDGAAATDMTISAKITGTSVGSLIKAGAGTLSMTGPNDYTGSTVIATNGGTLQAAVGTLVSTSSVTVNSGGTLLLSGDGRHLGANSPINLAGGTFNTGGFSEPNTAGLTIGALTLQSSSTIDLGNGASKLNFTDSHFQTWSGTLSILDWSGTPITGGGADQLLFGTSTTTAGLTVGQLAEILFVNPDGLAPGTYTAIFDPTNLAEIIPGVAVPEPGTWAAGGLVGMTLLAAASQELRRLTFLIRIRVRDWISGPDFWGLSCDG